MTLAAGYFDDIEFAIRSIGGSEGRRVSVNEYPGLDSVTVDDMGKAPSTYTLGIVFTGSDWYERYTAFMRRAGQAGPGELIHPEGWSRQVVIQGDVSHELIASGEATATVTFVAVDDSLSLIEREIPDETVVQAADDIEQVAQTSFVESIRGAIDKLETAMPDKLAAEVLAATRELESAMAAVGAAPAKIAQAWVDYTRAITDPTTLLSVAQHYRALYADTVIDTLGPASAARTQANAKAQAKMVATLATAQAAKLAISGTYADMTQAEGQIRTVSEACDGCIGVLDMTPQEATLMLDLQASMIAYLQHVIVRLPRTTTYQNDYVISAFEIAQELYQDGERADEIVARNAIEHPGFIEKDSMLSVLRV